MPIDPSMSMSEIIRKEVKAGKPQKQAVAIAYSVKGKDTAMPHRDRAAFLRRVSDAARAGKSAKDALSQGLAVREEAKLANGNDFFKQIRQGVRDGKPARQIIADALSVRR